MELSEISQSDVSAPKSDLTGTRRLATMCNS